MFDWRVRQARILDGSGAPWFRGDVGISDGRIVAVGDLTGAAARSELDAGDQYLAPGFIDAHTHSDFSLPRFPRGESRISQGVTTEVGGNCGLTPFPVDADRVDSLRRSSSFMATDLAFDWRSTEDYLRLLEGLPLSHNLVPLVGHGAIRVAVMGYDRREPDADELEGMKRLVAEAMEAGVAGLSSGLIYAPGSFAKTDELVELCRVVGRYGGLYTTHMRNESDGLLESVKEALAIGRQARVPVQISHHKAVGEANWGKVRESLALVDDARARGQDVTLDQYPYTAASTTFSAFLPDWALDGGVVALLDRLQDQATRERIAQETERKSPYRWDQVVVAAVRKPEHRQYEGLTIAEIGKQQGVAAVQAGLGLLLAEGAPFSIVRFGQSEEDVEYVMRHPQVMVGSDGYSISPAMGAKPHPRNYGTFPRVLGRYAREKGVVPLEEAIRKMTSLAAQRFGLRDRGLVRPGHVADLVLFDADRVLDTATYAEPHQYAAGIHWTMVRGEMVWREGRDTGAVVGQVLRARAGRVAAGR